MGVVGRDGSWASRAGAWVFPWVLAAALGGCGQDAPAGTRAAVSFCDDPVIESWYGDHLSFGTLGHPQGDVNVLGNVSGSEGIVSFEYSLNGAPPRPSVFGPVPFRLQLRGDFNVVIDRSELRDGANSLLLRAEDASGAVCEASLVLDYHRARNWPLPYAADFRTLESPEEIAEVLQVVDGDWDVAAGGLSEGQRGYYRLLAAGDAAWAPGYTARATATVRHLGFWSGVGMGIGWTGYEGSDEPPTDFGMAAFTWVRAKATGPSLEIKTVDHGTPASRPVVFEVDETYVFEVRTQPAGADRMRVDLRVWPMSGTRPDWLSATIASRRGSVVLISHGAEVIWHDLEVARPVLPDGGTRPDGGTPPDGGSAPDGGGAADGGTPSDGSVSSDGGGPGAAPLDAAANSGGSGGGSGGGCSVTDAERGTSWTWPLLIVLLGWLPTRRTAADGVSSGARRR